MTLTRNYASICIYYILFTPSCYARLEIISPQKPNAMKASNATYVTMQKDIIANPLRHLTAKTTAQPMHLYKERSEKNQLAFIRKHVTPANPLSLISECAGEFCPLSRRKYPERRNAAEQLAINAIKKLADAKRALQYVSIPSGNLLNDLRILTAACNNGLHAVDIHCIDLDYQKFIETFNTRTIHSDRPLSKKLSRDAYIVEMHTRFGQFLNWFAYLYPKTKVRLFIYADVDDYLRHTKTAADLIIGIDYDIADYTPGLYFSALKLLKTTFTTNFNALAIHVFADFLIQLTNTIPKTGDWIVLKQHNALNLMALHKLLSHSRELVEIFKEFRSIIKPQVAALLAAANTIPCSIVAKQIVKAKLKTSQPQPILKKKNPVIPKKSTLIAKKPSILKATPPNKLQQKTAKPVISKKQNLIVRKKPALTKKPHIKNSNNKPLN